MGRLFSQLLLLVKKNFILQYRRPVGALMELLLPCVFLGLISMVRFAIPSENHCFSYFQPFQAATFMDKQTNMSIIAMAPNNQFVNNIADRMVDSKDYLQGFSKHEYTAEQVEALLSMDIDTLIDGFGNSEDGESKVLRQVAILPTIELLNTALTQKSEYFSAAVAMDTETSYTLRGPADYLYYTELAYLSYFESGPSLGAPGYNSGWIALQQLIDRSILLEQPGFTKDDIPVFNIRQMPYPMWTENSFANAIKNTLPLMLVISFLWIGASISKELVGEKASRMKETMKMMGLTNWVLWSSWIIMRLILMFITVFLMVLVLKGASYLEHSNAVIIFIFLFEYAVSVMCFCFFLSTLFSKTTTAIAGTMLGYFMLYVPYFFLGAQFDDMSDSQRYLACLLSSTCVGFGSSVISKWETMQEGLQFGNFASQPSDLDTFTVGDVMLMLLVDIVLYSLMTWYVEAVFPGEYGIKQKPWFFITRKYWFGASSARHQPKTVSGLKTRAVPGVGLRNPSYNERPPDDRIWTLDDEEGPADNVELEEVLDEEMREEGAHEKGPKDKTVGISIKGLVKRFKTPKGKITAVNGLTLDMYEDQITSLLGHNGAGKTTTMSMLTGLYSPSGGDALINGHSILDNMYNVRESLGMCPQHNVLFDSLTVEEHLDFFIRLKGYTGDVKAEVAKMVRMLKLSDKTKSKADQLSGGMKRKLSVGIALAGGSRVVILDEPTAGMDPYARRATWDLILENKPGRTILLTTHYMDEADFLGDRVAIMTTGKLVCSGSSLFLKKKYGVGYHLTLVKGDDCDVPAVDAFIKSHVKPAKQISDVGRELVYVMPDEEVPNFIPLFKTLEDGAPDDEAVNIESFGLSLTTLEEVFMKVGESTEDKNLEKIAERQDENGHKTPHFKVFRQEELNSGITLLVQQLSAMITKRLINTMRYKKGMIVQLVLPILFTFLGLLVVLTTPEAESEASRAISLANYPGETVEGKLFTADFTNKDFFTDSMLSYLSELNLILPATDLTDTAKDLKDTYYTDDSKSCCAEPALQLNEKCAERGSSKDNWDECKDNVTWGYNACYDECFLGSMSSICGGSTVLPNDKYRSDYLSYYSNAFLRKQADADDPKFYRTHQVAYTYSEVPRFIDLVLDTTGSKINYADTTYTDYSLPTMSAEETDPQNMVTGWFSQEGLHLAPGVQNALINLLLIKKNSATRIAVTNHPLPRSLSDRFKFANVSPAGGSLGVMMLMGFSFLTASFCLFVVEERENKSKHLQQISGVNGVVYWLGTFIWDLLNYTVCILVITILFACFNLDGYNGPSIGAIFITMLMYGYASIPFVYTCSLAFSSPVTAFSIIATLTFISGLAGFIANMVLQFMQDDFQDTLDQILLFLPNYDFIGAITSIYANGIQKNLYKSCLDFVTSDQAKMCKTLEPTGLYDLAEFSIGRQLLAMFIVGTGCFVFILLQEVYGKSIRIFLTQLGRSMSGENLLIPGGEDDDVRRERERITDDMTNIASSEAVVFKELRKLYGSNVAVQNLTLGIPKNECFGLLGVNGAGKTTTFSMLTGDISTSHGEAHIAGYNLKTDIRKIQQRIGYCPQFDALIGIMTGRELLRMFANMRGIPKPDIEQTVNEAITNLNLDVHADKLCGTYSGGNKRKLSTAIALVGNPEVLFLDEPTAGMDPTARRFLWTVLSDLTSSNIGTSIVLTSHSMEECEALCNRLVIMVNGAFRCLGSIQHLKNKYGQGYTITLAMEESRQDECGAFISRTFPGAVCKEEHLGYLHYELGAHIKWSYIFDQMEQNKDSLAIEDYAVNQTSLEQVFLTFATEQASDPATPKTSCLSCLPCCKNLRVQTEADFKRSSVISYKASVRRSRRDTAAGMV